MLSLLVVNICEFPSSGNANIKLDIYELTSEVLEVFLRLLGTLFFK